jgi:hypothetical protein
MANAHRSDLGRRGAEGSTLSGPVSSEQPELSGHASARKLTVNSWRPSWHVACSLVSVLAPNALPNTARQTGGRSAFRGRGGSTFSRAVHRTSLGVAASLLALAPLIGCRSSLDLCADGCASGGGAFPIDVNETSGAGGREAAGGNPNEAAGSGGAPAVCKTNDDCADGLLCNGDERCDEDGVCAAGTALACSDGTTCTEGDPREPCGYAVQSPWLVLYGSGTLWGLPTAELGKRKLLVLGERESTALYVGMNDVTFSPDGRHAFIDFLEEDFGQAVLELSFGRGTPERARTLANLPNWGIYSTPVFSPDGARGLLSEFDTGAYFLDLSASRAVASQLDVETFDEDEVAFCSDNRTWLRKGPYATLYTETLGQPTATILDHEGNDKVELSPDARTIWLGGENPRLVACAPDATSEALGVVAEYAEFSPDSRFLVLTLADGSTTMLSVTASLAATEVWSGSDVAHRFWSEGVGSLVLHLESDDTSSYGYLPLSQDKPALVPLALDGAATILGCGRDACLARGPTQDEAPGPLLLQALDANAEPVPVGDDSAAAKLLLADFEHDRLFLQRTTRQGYELVLRDFAGAPERRLFGWTSGTIEVQRASDDSGILIRVEDNIEFSNYWVALPRSAQDEVTVVPLDVQAYRAEFQPWP